MTGATCTSTVTQHPYEVSVLPFGESLQNKRASHITTKCSLTPAVTISVFLQAKDRDRKQRDTERCDGVTCGGLEKFTWLYIYMLLFLS